MTAKTKRQQGRQRTANSKKALKAHAADCGCQNPPEGLVCEICGDKIENARADKRACYGCFLDGLVPRDYPAKEVYRMDHAVGHRNATERPPTGRPVLDARTMPRIYEIMPLARSRPRWTLDHDE